MPESFFKQSCRPEACIFIKKETLAQVFSCKFCEISKNTFSYRTPPVSASTMKGIISGSLMKINMHFLESARLSEFLILESKLFHSNIVKG